MILESLYFFLPAYFANMAPVLFKWLPFDKPIHKKLFGRNKTWRGIIVAILLGMLVFWLQKLLYLNGFQKLALIDYSDFSILLGFLMGTGAILSDLAKSYFKRKNGIESGKPWPFWDQIDFVVGGLALSFLVYIPRIEVVFVLFVVSPMLHVAASYIGYLLKLKKDRF